MSYQMAIWREYHRAAKYAKYVMNRDDVDRKSSFFRKLAKEWKSNLLGMCVCVCVCVFVYAGRRVEGQHISIYIVAQILTQVLGIVTW